MVSTYLNDRSYRFCRFYSEEDMENLFGKHLAFDTTKFRDAQQEFRLSEIKNKLIREAENKLTSHLKKSKIANVKILEAAISSLEIKEDLVSGAPIFTGKVNISATFLSGKQIKKADFQVEIVEGQPTIADQDFQKSLDSSGEIATTVEATGVSSTVTASLKDFSLVDDGGKYLKVYHTAAYGDLEPIGAVAKAEYIESSDKATLLKTMLQDEALAWPASVNFTDEFVEPSVKEAKKEDIFYKVKADASLTPAVEATADLTSKFKSADSLRLLVEAEKDNFNALQRRITQRALVALTDSLKSKKNHFKIKNTETSYDPESGTGKVVVHTELLDGKESKVVPLEVQITSDTMTLPTSEQITSLLKDTKTVESKEVTEVTVSELDAKLQKSANPNAPLNTGYQEVLRISKEYLPSSLKAGDVIEADGLRYKLVSKSEGQLSKERDTASHWTFERVHEDAQGDSPVYRVDY